LHEQPQKIEIYQKKIEPVFEADKSDKIKYKQKLWWSKIFFFNGFGFYALIVINAMNS